MDMTLARAQKALYHLRTIHYEPGQIPNELLSDLEDLLSAYENTTGNFMDPDEYEDWLNGELGRD